MTLREQQSLFLKLLPRLIDFAFSKPGWELVGKELERTPAQAMANASKGTGIPHSLHLICLAIDMELFIDGVWQKEADPYKPLGEFWISLHPLARWGGNFKSRDANHFSLEWNGIQ